MTERYDEDDNLLAKDVREWEIALMHLPSKTEYKCTAFARTADDAELCAFNCEAVRKEHGNSDEINPDEWEAIREEIDRSDNEDE